MHRTEGTDHAANLFNNGPPGTVVEQNWLNAVQEEIAYVIEQAGLVLKTASTETRQQLKQAILVFIANMISNDAYGAGWDGVDTIAPSKNAVYDKIANMISNDVYGAGWDGIETIAPSKNAVYDQIASMIKTEHRIPVFGAGVIAELAAMTDGQLIVGATGAAPVPKTITGDISITSLGVAAIGALKVTQSMLKTTTVELTQAHGGGTNQIVTGAGAYAFWPQVKEDGDGAVVVYPAQLATGATYVTNVYLNYSAGSGGTGYVQFRYVQSSGEVFWFFILRDINTKQILCTSASPDHCCFGNGGKPNLVPHPFIDVYKKNGKYYFKGMEDGEREVEIICINPSKEQLLEFKLKQDSNNDNIPDRSLTQVIFADYDIDEINKPNFPIEPVTIGLPIDWEDCYHKNLPVVPIKKVILKPDCIKTATLKLKK